MTAVVIKQARNIVDNLIRPESMAVQELERSGQKEVLLLNAEEFSSDIQQTI
jgi:hypothetical protein